MTADDLSDAASAAVATGPAAPDRPRRIGLTGPIGCGKSTVAGWLEDQGAVVIDADQLARHVTEPGSPGLRAVVEQFGRDVLAPDGSLDRAALGRRVFRDADALARLERIVHPAVRPLIVGSVAEAERAGAQAIVIEAIKLVEGGLAEMVDEVWLVVCTPDAQRERLLGRGADPADTEARIAAQSDIAARLAPSATRILDTSGSIEQTQAAVRLAFAASMGGPAGS
jgi:dephospho-CoA kinase